VGALEAHLRRQLDHSRDFFWHRVRWDVVRSCLPQRPVRLIDVGAGIGLLGEFLLRDLPGSRYRFVEPIPELVAELERQFGAAANANDATAYDEEFVTLLDVLEHQEDDRAFLAELCSKMAPGARLLLTVPALQSLWSDWDVALGHFRRYDRPTLARACAGLPLRRLEASYLFPEMLPPAWLRARRGGDGTAEFPDLPRVVNEALYRVSGFTARRRGRWSHGTSLFAVFERV
jgi:SAM-dependent methyltransferase